MRACTFVLVEKRRGPTSPCGCRNLQIISELSYCAAARESMASQVSVPDVQGVAHVSASLSLWPSWARSRRRWTAVSGGWCLCLVALLIPAAGLLFAESGGKLWAPRAHVRWSGETQELWMHCHLLRVA